MGPRSRTTRHLQIQEGFRVVQPVLPHQALTDATERIDLGRPEVDLESRESAHHPFRMQIPFEETPLDGAHPFVDAITEDEPAVLDVLVLPPSRRKRRASSRCLPMAPPAA